MCKKTMGPGCNCCQPGPFVTNVNGVGSLLQPLSHWRRSQGVLAPGELPAWALAFNNVLTGMGGSRIWGHVAESPENNGWDLYYIHRQGTAYRLYKYNTVDLTNVQLWSSAPNWSARVAHSIGDHNGFATRAINGITDFRIVDEHIVARWPGPVSNPLYHPRIRFPLSGPATEMLFWENENYNFDPDDPRYDNWNHGLNFFGAAATRFGDGGCQWGWFSGNHEEGADFIVSDQRPFITYGADGQRPFSPVLEYLVRDRNPASGAQLSTFSTHSVHPIGNLEMVGSQPIIARGGGTVYVRRSITQGSFSGIKWLPGVNELAGYDDPATPTFEAGCRNPEIRRTLGWDGTTPIMLDEEEYARAVADVALNGAFAGIAGNNVLKMPGQNKWAISGGFVKGVSANSGIAWWLWNGTTLKQAAVAGGGSVPIYMLFPANDQR